MESVNSRMTKVNQQYDYNIIYLIILKHYTFLFVQDMILSYPVWPMDSIFVEHKLWWNYKAPPGLRLIAVPAYLKNITNDTFYHQVYAEVMASAALITQLVLIIPETASINVTKCWSPTAPPSYVTTMGLKAAQQIQ